ncbi:MAG TPA: AAA family ATPase [Burkholderiales bacterium]|nr:AAA family ATPase [Burkholderiales bacterium]
MIEQLRDPARYPHPVERVELIETHISWVLLAGDFAYKLKKPVELGFLDFRSLEARRFYCEEELRLNRRTAPRLYLDLVAITGSEADPRLGGEGEVIDYAVKMRRFPQDALLSRMAQAGTLGAAHIDALARGIAAFHSRVARADAAGPFGSAAEVLAPAAQNFDQIEGLLGAGADLPELERLRRWTLQEHARLSASFEARKADGFVRECHGDLHLGNVALIDGEPVPFDGIEFNEALRWIDVMNEVAFLVMDLFDRRLPRLAWRFLNAYLEATGDYAGLPLLRFYLVYRALVRAKVACIRDHQPGLDARTHRRAGGEYLEYLRLAQALAARPARGLIVMHGVAGSGKTTVAQELLEACGAVRLRSDAERKRLQGLEAGARTGSALGGGIYSPQLTAQTYARLAALSGQVLEAGYAVIVDATFLARAQRAKFADLARKVGVPFAIALCEAPAGVLRERVATRRREARDASEADLAVLARQLESREPLTPTEQADAVRFDAGETRPAAVAALARHLGLPLS